MLPRKLKLLHEGEEFLRARSIDAIKENDDMMHHVNVIECAMDTLNFFAACAHDNNDDEINTIRLLGIRLFNGCAASTNLTLSGYYQGAAMLMRDLLETAFLLAYLEHDRTKIREWREASDHVRKSKFSAFKVRVALDEKDGFTEKRRAAAYEILCEMASHPTYKGFRMLKPLGQDHHCGPFLDINLLKPLLEELAKLSIQAGQSFSIFFNMKSKDAFNIKLNFLKARGEWMERYFGLPFEKSAIDEIKAHISDLP